VDIYIYIFWIVPLLLLSSLFFSPISGTRTSTGHVSSSNYIQQEFSNDIKQSINSNTRQEIFYFFGKNLELPIYKTCLSNEGMRDPIEPSSFQGNVTVNNNLYFNCHILINNIFVDSYW
jgi:hypothetical protein